MKPLRPIPFLLALVLLSIPVYAELTDKQKAFEKTLFAKTEIFDKLYFDLFEDETTLKSAAKLEEIVASSDGAIKELSSLQRATIGNLKRDSSLLDTARWNSLENAARNQSKAFRELNRGAAAQLFVLRNKTQNLGAPTVASELGETRLTSDLYMELTLTNAKQAYLWTLEALETAPRK